MLESFTDTLVQTIETNVWLAPVAALVGGLLTALNPCVISAIPLMMAYVAGQQERPSVARSFMLSGTFVVGLTCMFGLMYMTTWALSSVLGMNEWRYIAAGVCLLMGLHMLGILKFTIPAPAGFQPAQRGFVGAFLLGALFGLLSLPCAGPILVALLAVTQLQGHFLGAALLVSYSFGHCALILVAGTSVALVQKMITSKRIQSVNFWGKRIAGVVMLGVGVLLLVG